jgi:hypothetical protein
MAGDAGATITETEAGRDAAVFALEFLNAPDITQMQRGALVVLLTMIFHGETEEIRATALAALQAAANTSDRDPSRGPAMMVKIFRG